MGRVFNGTDVLGSGSGRKVFSGNEYVVQVESGSGSGNRGVVGIA